MQDDHPVADGECVGRIGAFAERAADADAPRLAFPLLADLDRGADIGGDRGVRLQNFSVEACQVGACSSERIGADLPQHLGPGSGRDDTVERAAKGHAAVELRGLDDTWPLATSGHDAARHQIGNDIGPQVSVRHDGLDLADYHRTGVGKASRTEYDSSAVDPLDRIYVARNAALSVKASDFVDAGDRADEIAGATAIEHGVRRARG